MPPDSPNPSPTQEVERYQPVVVPVTQKVGDPYNASGVIPAPSGEFVLFADHQQLLQAEVEKREEVEEEARDLGARLLVAASKHQAAVEDKEEAQRLAIGRKRVIEEVEDELEERVEDHRYHPQTLNAYGFALKLLRDKGTEQGGADA